MFRADISWSRRGHVADHRAVSARHYAKHFHPAVIDNGSSMCALGFAELADNGPPAESVAALAHQKRVNAPLRASAMGFPPLAYLAYFTDATAPIGGDSHQTHSRYRIHG